MIGRARRIMSSVLFDVATAISRLRRRRAGAADYRRIAYREQTRRMGLRVDERLRDLLRGHWLRLRRSSDHDSD